MTTDRTHRHPKKTYNCSFCGKNQNQVQRLIAGPASVYICNECLDLCQEILATPTSHSDQNTSTPLETVTPITLHSCSFCHKSQDQVQSLIAGPGGIYICGECTDLYRERIEAEHVALTPHPVLDTNPPPETTTPNTSPQTPYSCSFCGKSQDQVQSLIAGPGGIYVCGECIDLHRERIEAGHTTLPPYPAPNTSPPETTIPNKPAKTPYSCSFCGKSRDQVQRLIAGSGGVYICDECVSLCREIIQEENEKRT